MSYFEKGDTVMLHMSRDDYERLLLVMGTATGAALMGRGVLNANEVIKLLNRLNEGNPNYTPYQVQP